MTSNADGSVWTFTIRKDSQWSDGSPCAARDFEWSWKRQMDPASKNPYSIYFYDIKGAEPFNKSKVAGRASEVGMRAKDDWTLEVTLEGPRGYFPVLSAYLAALPGSPALGREARRQVDGGRQHRLQRTLRARVVGAQQGHGADAGTSTSSAPRTSRSSKVTIPIVPVQSGALPLREQRARHHARCRRAISAAARRSAHGQGRCSATRSRARGTLIPQATKPPFDNVKVRRAVGHAIDRENVVKVADGLRHSRPLDDPAGLPGAVDDKKIRDIQRFDPKAAMAHAQGHAVRGRAVTGRRSR